MTLKILRNFFIPIFGLYALSIDAYAGCDKEPLKDNAASAYDIMLNCKNIYKKAWLSRMLLQSSSNSFYPRPEEPLNPTEILKNAPNFSSTKFPNMSIEEVIEYANDHIYRYDIFITPAYKFNNYEKFDFGYEGIEDFVIATAKNGDEEFFHYKFLAFILYIHELDDLKDAFDDFESMQNYQNIALNKSENTKQGAEILSSYGANICKADLKQILHLGKMNAEKASTIGIVYESQNFAKTLLSHGFDPRLIFGNDFHSISSLKPSFFDVDDNVLNEFCINEGKRLDSSWLNRKLKVQHKSFADGTNVNTTYILLETNDREKERLKGYTVASMSPPFIVYQIVEDERPNSEPTCRVHFSGFSTTRYGVNLLTDPGQKKFSNYIVAFYQPRFKIGFFHYFNKNGPGVVQTAESWLDERVGPFGLSGQATPLSLNWALNESLSVFDDKIDWSKFEQKMRDTDSVVIGSETFGEMPENYSNYSHWIRDTDPQINSNVCQEALRTARESAAKKVLDANY